MNHPGIKEMFTKRFIGSMIYGTVKQNTFRNIQSFCMFIGYPRSGHSFIGALIDAHPNASMGMEVDALNLVRLGYSKNQLFCYLIRSSKIFTKKLKNQWSGYSYAVPGQYQGKYTTLKLIGDKRGGKSTLHLMEDFSLYKKLMKLVKCKVKVLHIIRHPLDNISTIILMSLKDNHVPIRTDFEAKIDLYFESVKFNSEIKRNGNINILDVYHEDLISKPREQLLRILDHLELDPEPSYLNSCIRQVYKEPNLSREKLIWPEDMLSRVHKEMSKYEFLKKYLSDE